ncbi:unnamed protein product [Eruca vesicaria subsp. sativa]|uniref:Signal recognition particle receptor alpha subunit N-terminal domain-containing protein n=1 Tax=Eruca vesicaria subsp. sativa TaxID=29727 RepID=A0ABC8J046_ERUVS|nr:unnamed protein product [Eruca vesicaria subsp. sativa]
MLEQLLIFTRGGLILWTCKELGNALKGSPIDTLIRSCLLEERSSEVSFNYEAYTLKWTFHNDLGLVFVAVYQRILHLLYVDDFLSMVKQSFSEIYDPKRMTYDDFDDTFRQLRKEAEARGEELRKTKQVGKPVGSVKKQGQAAKSGLDGGSKSSNGESGGGSKKDDGDGDKGVRGRGGVRKTDSIGNKSSKVTAVEPPKKATKKNRVWDDAAPKQVKLDFTDSVGENGNGNEEHVDIVAADQGESMMDKEEIFSSDGESEDDDDDEPDIVRIKVVRLVDTIRTRELKLALMLHLLVRPVSMLSLLSPLVLSK